MSESANIVIHVGKHKEVEFTRKANGSVVDITGWQYRAMVKENADSTAALATFTCEVTSGGGGVVVCTLTSGDTANLTPQDAVWDVEETAVSGEPVRLFSGRARIRKPVTS